MTKKIKKVNLLQEELEVEDVQLPDVILHSDDDSSDDSIPGNINLCFYDFSRLVNNVLQD
jgi:hypothetical protein